jgi:hypothetical protein
MKQWPKTGSKVTFKGVHLFWFVNIIKDADELLEVGKEYTVSKIELASSWCAVILKEFPDKKFALSFFNYPKELTTEEVKMAELDASATIKYEFTSLEELRDRALKHAEEVLDVCTKHSEALKNSESPKEAIKHCDNFQNLMKEYEADSEKITQNFKNLAKYIKKGGD